jgi:predicted DsbA family dithiol-disulfide isomerase
MDLLASPKYDISYTHPVKIEVWSDTVCPWCYIGLKRLQQALAARPHIAAEVVWLPFELNPELPEPGMGRREYMQAKFGDPDRFKPMLAQMRAIAAELGIDYRPERQTRMPNTRRSHMLIAAAGTRQMAVKEAILRAYFTAGEDIGDVAVLERIGLEAGLAPGLAATALANAELRQAVEQHEIQARAMNITGVPMFVFNRELGFSGAQELPVFLQVLDRAYSGTAN